MKTKILLMAFLALIFGVNMQAQLSIDAENTEYSINFDESFSGVCNGQFSGSGFAVSPVAGQLDSDAWATTGMSDGDGSFGASNTSGDFARGNSNGGVSSGGFYAFTVAAGNNVLGVQPTSSDFNPGTIVLKLLNNSGVEMNSLTIGYNIVAYNNENRSSTLNFAWSDDNISYTDLPSLDYTTTEAEDASPVWETTPRNTTLSGLTVADGGYFYLRWNSVDAGGSGSRDEFGIDDIVVNANAGAKPEPTNYPGDFAASPVNTSSIENIWSDATGGTVPDGYLILSNMSGIFTPPVDGNSVADDADLTDGEGAMNIAYGVETYTWTGLNPSTQYFFVIYPYTNSGAEIAYKTDGIPPTANASTNTPPAIVINEINADPDPTDGDANGDGVVDSFEDEFVELINNSGSAVNISGFTLSDAISVRHMFPAGTIIPAHDVLVVFGGGTPTGFGSCLVQTASTGQLGLNNSGDNVIVKNLADEVVASETYGSEGGDNQSLTRDPDISGDFVKHSIAPGSGGALYSPCRKVDGSSFVQPYDMVVELKDSNGDLLEGGSLEYREGGGNPWQTATEFSSGEFGIDTERSQIGLRMTYGPMIKKIGAVPTGNNFTFSTELVTVKLEDAGGNGIEGGLVDFTSDGWYSFGTTAADGTVQMEMLPLQYTFRMIYDGDRFNKTEIISSSNNTITFLLDELKLSPVNSESMTDLTIYPNPWQSETTIAFELEVSQHVSISVFDLNGRLVDIIYNGNISEGRHRLVWKNEGLNEGIYICRLVTEEDISVQTLVKQ